MGAAYVGRFAPSPTGPLHAGSLVAALASWLDARMHGGQWLVRIEDVDTPRCLPEADAVILGQLAACGLKPDTTPAYQSQRGALYQNALEQLVACKLAYPCGCTRQDIVQALSQSGQARQRHAELVYPGTCRNGLKGRLPRAWRFLVESIEDKRPVALFPREKGDGAIELEELAQETPLVWHDRLLGLQSQHVCSEVGDFVLRRADGLWAYQLAVVVDDAAQSVTHVVRGQDLADSTARQILLQRALGFPQPHYLHVPLVLGANGEKLSKQNGAQPLDTSNPVSALEQAGGVLGLPEIAGARAPEEWLARAVPLWAACLERRPLKLKGD